MDQTPIVLMSQGGSRPSARETPTATCRTRWDPPRLGSDLAHHRGVIFQVVRLLSLSFTALILGGVFCHVLEMPVKMTLAPSDYMIVQQIYSTFGPIGAVLEPAAILCATALAWLVRGRRAFAPALVGGLCLVASLMLWVAIVSPVNPHWAAAAQAQTVPDNFESLRSRWEWGHAIHACGLFAGFVALVVSVLVEIPTCASAAVAPRSTRSVA
jgi:hypothetical protein